MKLLEYEAKNILKKYSIPIPQSQLVDGTKLPHVPVVLKSQVPVGGRGKAGGIKVVDESSLVPGIISELLNLEIKGYRPLTILAEELLSIKS